MRAPHHHEGGSCPPDPSHSVVVSLDGARFLGTAYNSGLLSSACPARCGGALKEPPPPSLPSSNSNSTG